MSKYVMNINFIEWLYIQEAEGGVRCFLKANPKNPKQNFLTLYGNTQPIADKLGSKGLGFRYFKGTWSLPDFMIKPETKIELEKLGVDLTCLDSPNTSAPTDAAVPASVATPASAAQQPSTPADEMLNAMQKDLNKAIKDAGYENAKLRGLMTDIDNMIEHVANSADEAAKQSFIQNFLKFASRFHNYSLHNQLLIWIQNRNARYVKGATQWPSLGRTVSKWKNDQGETTAITILRPNFKKTTKTVIDPITKQSREEESKLHFFKAAKVYDIGDTEPIPGHPSPFQPVSRKDWSKDSNENRDEVEIMVNALKEWAKEKGIDVDVEKLSSEEGGYSAGGKIRINDTFKGINLFSTLVHETAHELLHWLEENSTKTIAKTSTSKEREIDAETTAYIVLNHFGFETQDTANYLALWQTKGDEIRARRENIQKAAKEIIEAIHSKIPQQDVTPPDEENDVD
jgi:hypothetical protein